MTTTESWAATETADSHDIRSCIDEETLADVLVMTWSTFVDAQAELVHLPAPAAARSALVAEVRVTGPIPILVSLGMDGEVAREVTREMLRRSAGAAATTEDVDVTDAIGELANVLGGNLKAMLPEGSSLSLPVVASKIIAADGVPGGIAVDMAWGPHVVTVMATHGHVTEETPS